MKARTLSILALAILAALWASTSGVNAQTADEPDPASAAQSEAREFDENPQVLSEKEFREVLLKDTSYTVEEWVPAWDRHRGLFGFPGLGAELGLELALSAEGQRGYALYGVPLSTPEQAKLAKHTLHSAELAELKTQAEDIDGFAGISSKSFEDGLSHHTIRFTSRPSPDVLDSLAALMSDRSMVSFDFSAKSSLRELEKAAEDLFAIGKIGGAQLHRVSVDIDNNRVQAVVESEEASRKGLNSGGIVDEVAVVIGEPASFDACPTRKTCDQPLRAGVEAQNIQRNDYCTTGFAMKDQVTGKYFMSTAEHCGHNGDDFFISFIANREQFGESPDIDVAIIEIFSADESNVLFKKKGDTLKRITSIEAPVYLDPVCVHSVQFGRSCGTALNHIGSHTGTGGEGVETYISGFDYQLVLPGEWVCGTPGPGQRSHKGASGAPITSPWGSKAYGTHSSCASTIYIYPSTLVSLTGMDIIDIEAALVSPTIPLDVDVMTSAAE